MDVSPATFAMPVASELATDAISAAISHSPHLVARVISQRRTASVLRRIDRLLGSLPDTNRLEMSQYLDSCAGRKILTALAYLTVIEDDDSDAKASSEDESKTGGKSEEQNDTPSRRRLLRDLFMQEVRRNCPAIDDNQAERVWRYWAETFRLTVGQLRSGGMVEAYDLLAATSIFGDTRVDEKTGKSFAVLPASLLRRAAINADEGRIEEIYGAIRSIRSCVADSYKYIELPHLRELHRVPIDELYVRRTLAYVEFPGGQGRWSEGTSGAESWSYSTRLPPRVVILGNPGVGKSTYVRQLLYSVSTNETGAAGRIAPMLLNLREYASAQASVSFASALAESIESVYQLPTDKATVEDILSMGMGLVIFDGLDEILDLSQRRSLVQRIELFSKQYSSCDIVVTSREVGYWPVRLDMNLFVAVTLPPFTSDQIDEYVHRWFSGTAAEGEDPELLASCFMAESTYAQDLLPNPLMLSLICGIYQYSGYIPENRPSLYEECSRLLFYRWDRIRHIGTSWKEAKMLSLVQELAGFFFRSQSAQGGIPERQIRALVRNYIRDNIIADPEEAEEQARDFVDYCSGRAWVISKVGTDRGERLYGFTHRTFMEYFAARSMVRESSSPSDLVDHLRPIISSSRSEVIPQIALQIYEEQVLAGGADQCIYELLFRPKLPNDIDERYLLFTLKALQFVGVKPATASRVFFAAVDIWSRDPEGHRYIPRMLVEVSEDTASNFRRAVQGLCAEIEAKRTETVKLQPVTKIADEIRQLVLDDSAWAATCERVRSLSVSHAHQIAEEDPSFAFSLVCARKMSASEWAGLHGVGGLFMFRHNGKMHEGLSVRIVADNLVQKRRRRSVVSMLLRKLPEVRPTIFDMFTRWLIMIDAKLDLMETRPQVSASDDASLLCLACLEVLTEEGDIDAIPTRIYSLVNDWFDFDVIQVAADARSEFKLDRGKSLKSVIDQLTAKGTPGFVCEMVRKWIIDGASICDRSRSK